MWSSVHLSFFHPFSFPNFSLFLLPRPLPPPYEFVWCMVLAMPYPVRLQTTDCEACCGHLWFGRVPSRSFYCHSLQIYGYPSDESSPPMISLGMGHRQHGASLIACYRDIIWNDGPHSSALGDSSSGLDTTLGIRFSFFIVWWKHPSELKQICEISEKSYAYTILGNTRSHSSGIFSEGGNCNYHSLPGYLNDASQGD